jgi:hypothetical protein
MRYFVRLFGRGVFVALAGLALAIATVSFLTACRCDEPFINRSEPIVTKPSREDIDKALNTNPKTPPPLPQPITIPPIPDTKGN